MSPLAVALAIELAGAAALILMFALYRGPATGPGTHRRTAQHRATTPPAAAPFIEYHRPAPASTWRPYILDDEPHGSTIDELIDRLTPAH